MRNPGTHMGVCEDGSFAGSLSGGCIENAVIAEAQAALKQGDPRLVRFGAGSPYMDIKLPCGGGLDIHFQPLEGAQFVDACRGAINDRKPFSVRLGRGTAEFVSDFHPSEFDRKRETGVFGHWPAPRLLIIGHGAGVLALAHLSEAMLCDVSVLTPDEQIFRTLNAASMDVQRLEKTSETQLMTGDPWTAIVFLFHDHDWETLLMAHALQLPHFYIGAMGGRKAHAVRTKALAEIGVSDEAIDTIHAPIGLFHSSRDPQTLALSTLSQVISVYQNTDFGG